MDRAPTTMIIHGRVAIGTPVNGVRLSGVVMAGASGLVMAGAVVMAGAIGPGVLMMVGALAKFLGPLVVAVRQLKSQLLQ